MKIAEVCSRVFLRRGGGTAPFWVASASKRRAKGRQLPGLKPAGILQVCRCDTQPRETDHMQPDNMIRARTKGSCLFLSSGVLLVLLPQNASTSRQLATVLDPTVSLPVNTAPLVIADMRSNCGLLCACKYFHLHNHSHQCPTRYMYTCHCTNCHRDVQTQIFVIYRNWRVFEMPGICVYLL